MISILWLVIQLWLVLACIGLVLGLLGRWLIAPPRKKRK